ncbi:carboxymuconolactone decarboxylase family protein [Kistimonas asteriae]|uniref:carboxymuconolactone decarboxylase family protein n=1 Tax=Kistimonas asteriae TaxID=517724 RepID=UPI001BAB1BEC|nr:carboxymuconolactone decarboxylase family protein [Kistimonas asteriae]
MHKRIDISKLEPTAYEAMLGLEGYIGKTDLSDSMKELIKIRVSMINQCAFCIQMHTEQALKIGETQKRLFALAAWKESPLFSETERVVLALADEITKISVQGVTDETYNNCLEVLGENKLAQCIMQIITINAWNRIALSTKMVHEN